MVGKAHAAIGRESMAKPALSHLQTLPLTGSTTFPDSGAQWGSSVQIQKPTVDISH